MTSLRELRAPNRQITDAGVAQLSTLKNLTLLDLSATQITGAGLESLKGLPKLEGLLLGGTRMNAADLTHLGRLQNIKQLDLSDRRPGAAGLSEFDAAGSTPIAVAANGQIGRLARRDKELRH